MSRTTRRTLAPAALGLLAVGLVGCDVSGTEDVAQADIESQIGPEYTSAMGEAPESVS